MRWIFSTPTPCSPVMVPPMSMQYFEHFLGGMQHVLHLRFVAIVVEEDRMDVAVAGVEDVVDIQAVLPADLADARQHFGQHAARDAGVLRAVAVG